MSATYAEVHPSLPRVADATAPRFRIGDPAPLRRRGPGSLSFDPVRLGSLECDAWVAYYSRDWAFFLRDGLRAARGSLGLSWPATLACAWLAMRASRRWAPFPDNDPAGARRLMRSFYRIVRRRTGLPLDPARAAELEVAWWHLHREINHVEMPDPYGRLAESIARLWAHVYGVDAAALGPAAAARARAAQLNDRWLADGGQPQSVLMEHAREALIDAYSQLHEVLSA